MVKGIPYPHYYYIHQPIDLMQKLINDLENGNRLKNKYLYFGWNGAFHWNRVEQSYLLTKQKWTLIDRHIEQIYNKMVRRTGENVFDIISLGVGTGTDDKTIVEWLSSHHKHKNFSIITIDLSWCLLQQGTQNIFSLIQDRALKNYVDLVGICCDFEEISKAEHIIKYSPDNNIIRKNKIGLFHLLGLTLANNSELALLEQISSVMNEDDFLIVSVDFSADDNEALKRSQKAYEEGVSGNYINRFLLSPLESAIRFNGGDRMTDIMLKGKFLVEEGDEFNALEGPINIFQTKENNEKNLSCVKDAYNFTRYYRDSRGVLRLCDFSNKYKLQNFGDFLDSLFYFNIPLKLVAGIDQFGITQRDLKAHQPRQYFVLLQKVSFPKPVQIKNFIQDINKILHNIYNATKHTDKEFAKKCETLQTQIAEKQNFNKMGFICQDVELKNKFTKQPIKFKDDSSVTSLTYEEYIVELETKLR